MIDSAKVFAAANGDFKNIQRFLEAKDGAENLSKIPIIAVPTTAGTGSEVTCWATVWDEANKRKLSLARPGLYPETAIVDPALMIGKPRGLTLATGLECSVPRARKHLERQRKPRIGSACGRRVERHR